MSKNAPASSPGVEPKITFEDLPLTGMSTDPRYQQPLAELKVLKILKKGFNPAALGVMVVSRRDDGTIAIIDGQHRSEAGRRAGHSDLYRCEVHHGLTIQQEAELFLEKNTQWSPTSTTKFLARLTAGEPEALQIADILNRHGWGISRSHSHTPGALAAVNSIERVYRSAGRTMPPGEYGKITDTVMYVITQAWGRDPKAGAGSLIEGVAQFYGRYGDRVDTRHLISVMSNITPATVLAKARATRDADSGNLPAHVGRTLHGLYNRRKRSNPLPDWTWNR